MVESETLNMVYGYFEAKENNIEIIVNMSIFRLFLIQLHQRKLGKCEDLRYSSNCCLCGCVRGSLSGSSTLAMAARMMTAVAMRAHAWASLGDVFGPNKPISIIGRIRKFG